MQIDLRRSKMFETEKKHWYCAIYIHTHTQEHSKGKKKKGKYRPWFVSEEENFGPLVKKKHNTLKSKYRIVKTKLRHSKDSCACVIILFFEGNVGEVRSTMLVNILSMPWD